MLALDGTVERFELIPIKPTICPSNRSSSVLSYQIVSDEYPVWRDHSERRTHDRRGASRPEDLVSDMWRFSSRVRPRVVPDCGVGLRSVQPRGRLWTPP